MFVDSHAHLYKEYYDDIASVIFDAASKNVGIIISCGCDKDTNKEVLSTVKDFPNLYGALGIHPEYQFSYQKEDLDFIEENLNNNKIVAIGEIGLDYHYENYDKQGQILLLEKQLEVAEKYNLPVIIHSRDAGYDTLNILKKYHVTGVIHAFSGSYELAQEYIKLGFYLGVGGVVTFKNAHIKDVIEKIGLNNVLLETDCPYLAPDPIRGSQNNPGNVLIIATFLSKILNMPLEKVMQITTDNVYKLFTKIPKI